MAPRLLRVEVPWAVVGAEVDANGQVVRAAPLVRWAVGKPVAVLMAWAKRKGGSWTWVAVLALALTLGACGRDTMVPYTPTTTTSTTQPASGG